MDSLPFANFTCAYSGFVSKSSTSSTSGSYLLCLFHRLSNTAPGVLSQVCTEFPEVEWGW